MFKFLLTEIQFFYPYLAVMNQRLLQYTIFLICLFLGFSSCQKKALQPPSLVIGDAWLFQQSGSEEWYPATVPGVVHTDLLANKLIEDPYWENNEQKLQWIEKEDWSYKTTFTVNEQQLENNQIELQFDGLDTYAEVKLNGQLILKATNMFRQWTEEVKENLVIGENQLEVNFQSPQAYNKTRYDAYPYSLPSGSEVEEPRVGSFTRKAAYHFGWDWGPRFVTAGIWKEVSLVFWNNARIKDAYCYTIELSEQSAKVHSQITVEIKDDQPQHYTIDVDGQKNKYLLDKGIHTIDYSFDVEKPKLWWCNGLGEPYLYNMDVGLYRNDVLVDTLQQKYGIRTIELVNEKDSIGTSYYFKLNGQNVFMKGANYIPQDAFLTRVNDDQYHRLIADVKEANMNMVRVWGGGVYEKDIFYDLCDQNGILIWQDFMFAGSLYPNNQAFVDNVKQEVIENITRLRKHPSIALWCGNNEIEVAWNNWGWQTQYGYSDKDTAQIWQDYQAIFHQLIPGQVAQLDPSRSYVPTSPLSNWGKLENFNHSSMHYWGVWHGRDVLKNLKTMSADLW